MEIINDIQNEESLMISQKYIEKLLFAQLIAGFKNSPDHQHG